MFAVLHALGMFVADLFRPALRLEWCAYGQKIKTAAKMTVVQASTMEQLSAPFRTAPHGSA
jgi:hypothetical protein